MSRTDRQLALGLRSTDDATRKDAITYLADLPAAELGYTARPKAIRIALEANLESRNNATRRESAWVLAGIALATQDTTLVERLRTHQDARTRATALGRLAGEGALPGPVSMHAAHILQRGSDDDRRRLLDGLEYGQALGATLTPPVQTGLHRLIDRSPDDLAARATRLILYIEQGSGTALPTHRRPVVRAAAAETLLAQQPAALDAPSIARLLTDAAPTVRTATLDALARLPEDHALLHQPAVQCALDTLLDQPHHTVTVATLLAAQDVASPNADRATRLAEHGDPPVQMAVLHTWLGARSTAHQLQALALLEGLHNTRHWPEADSPLLERSVARLVEQAPMEQVRHRAARVAAQWAQQRGDVTALATLLNSADPAVSAAVVATAQIATLARLRPDIAERLRQTQAARTTPVQQEPPARQTPTLQRRGRT